MADDADKRCPTCRAVRNLLPDSDFDEIKSFVAFVSGAVLDGTLDHNVGKVLIDAASKSMIAMSKKHQRSEMDELHSIDKRMQDAVNRRVDMEATARKGQATVSVGRIALPPDGETKH